LWLPYVWGSEAIAWRTDMWQPPSKTLSYGDLWQPELEGLLMMQPHSGMLAAGLALEARGELAPGAMRAAYDNEDQMRLTWQQVTAFCVRHKSQVKLFWNDANAQVNALLNEGVMAGQAWDGPALALRTHGEPIDYRAPREGALAWVDGFALSGEAKNLPQAYAFLDFCFDAQRAGEAIREHGYNSAVIGAEKFADKAYRENYQAAYQADDVQNLWIWPSEPAWYAKARKEFRNQFVNA
ncbi:MAG: extracellular solute-binding protein, partial [Granulosicoccaceae bacterium]